jgi:hypothetical protein
MPPADDYAALLNSVLVEWNRAEEDIKIAEQVASKVVNPSIKELRYAGRRIVEALVKLQKNEPAQEICKLLNDALFDCHRARHDAIDAGTSKIAFDIEIMISKLGYEVILPVHPDFHNLIKDLRKVRANIRESRRDRENREAIYSVLESVNFPALVNSYEDLQENENIMKAIARRRRRSELIGVLGAVFGVLGILAAFFAAWYFSR